MAKKQRKNTIHMLGVAMFDAFCFEFLEEDGGKFVEFIKETAGVITMLSLTSLSNPVTHVAWLLSRHMLNGLYQPDF